MEYINIKHTFEPVYNKNSSVLILGTFPSVKSRENNFYYGHPQNRFWRVIAEVTSNPVPGTAEDKKRLLLDNGIAIWDVIESCTINGSSDSSIKDVVPNDISKILNNTNIVKIGANGAKAYDLYMKHVYKKTGIEIIKLPSTSPANAAWSIERLVEEYSIFLK